MKTVTITAVLIMMAASLFHEPLAAQIGLETSVNQVYDDNVNNNYQQLRSTVTTLRLSGGYAWTAETAETKAYYDGTFSYYQPLLARTHQFHSANVVTSLYGGDDGENVLRLGGMYGVSFNRDSYTIFDHTMLSGVLEYKYFVNEWFINKLGYTFRSIRFSGLDEFSYAEHALSEQGAFAVTSTTTLIVQADLGSKFYTSSSSTPTSSMRRGSLSSILPSVTQLTGMVRVGQRITDETGIAATGRYLWNLQKQTRYLNTEYGSISDDEVFDDHYGYEGLQSSVMLTHLISESMKLKLTGGFQNKLYALAAFDLAGVQQSDQRKDIRTYMSLSAERNFDDLGFSLRGSVEWIRNASNDAYYDYRNSVYGIEVGIPF